MRMLGPPGCFATGSGEAIPVRRATCAVSVRPAEQGARTAGARAGPAAACRCCAFLRQGPSSLASSAWPAKPSPAGPTARTVAHSPAGPTARTVAHSCRSSCSSRHSLPHHPPPPPPLRRRPPAGDGEPTNQPTKQTDRRTNAAAAAAAHLQRLLLLLHLLVGDQVPAAGVRQPGVALLDAAHLVHALGHLLRGAIALMLSGSAALRPAFPLVRGRGQRGEERGEGERDGPGQWAQGARMAGHGWRA